jgi:hypothetical protein
VPAAAAIRGRLVLFILIRFKGYLDSIFGLIKRNGNARVLYEEGRTFGVEIQFIDTKRTSNGEGDLLCKN